MPAPVLPQSLPHVRVCLLRLLRPFSLFTGIGVGSPGVRSAADGAVLPRPHRPRRVPRGIRPGALPQQTHVCAPLGPGRPLLFIDESGFLVVFVGSVLHQF